MHQSRLAVTMLAAFSMTACSVSSPEPVASAPRGARAPHLLEPESPVTDLPISDCTDVDGWETPSADVARVILLSTLPPDETATYLFALSTGTKALPLASGCAIDVPGGPTTVTLSRGDDVVTQVVTNLTAGKTTVAIPSGDPAAPTLLFDLVDRRPTVGGGPRIVLSHVARDAQVPPIRVFGSDNYDDPLLGTRTKLVDSLSFLQRVVIDAPFIRSLIFDNCRNETTQQFQRGPDICNLEIHLALACATPFDETLPCGNFGPGGPFLAFQVGCQL